MTRKRILCFGDSNTWGYVPGMNGVPRYDEDTRWTSLLQKKLNDTYEIIEFGLCGCTSGFAYEVHGVDTNGRDLYPSILFAHLPVDIVLIMLGTNDLKIQNNWQPGDTAKNLDALISITRGLAPGTKIILAPATILRKGFESDPELDPATAIESSRLCAKEVAELAKQRDTLFFDTNQFVHELAFDGCHFSAAAHKAFAEGLADFLTTKKP